MMPQNPPNRLPQTPDQALTDHKRDSQLKLLNEVSNHLQSLLESENIYQEIINIIQTRFNYYCTNIWSVDQNHTATLRAQTGAYHNHLKLGYVLPKQDGVTRGIIGKVIETGKPYLSNDITKDPIYTHLALPIRTRAELCVPILKNNEIMGILNIENDEVNSFDANDVITLEAIALQIAVAITNQKLFSEVKTLNKTLLNKIEENTHELRHANEKILDQQKYLKKENFALKTIIDQEKKSHETIGKSAVILNMLSMVDKIAPTPVTVLIQGESGTGKELVARSLHAKSDRAEKPYITVNCGALQESLLESELFGHEKGSFTGAVSQKIGLCELADGGTVFLDEIGELSLGIQAKLLRFLQEGEFYRIGGKKPFKVDVRVISATNRDLENEVKAGRFREDLFYRLNTITLRMPPLRKRKVDIPLLVEYFLENSRFGTSAQKIKKIDPRVLDAFARYDWPGNIRELQNTLERLKILAENQEIKLEDIPMGIRMPMVKTQSLEDANELSLLDVEKNHILRTLTVNQGNKTKTAKNLGITIKTLYNKLHHYGILQTQGSSELTNEFENQYN